MSQANYMYNKILEYLIGNRTFANADTFYIALSFNAKDEEVSEPSGNSYARSAVNNDSENWSAQVNGVIKNTKDISFEESTDSWGTETIKSIAIYDSPSNGNLLYTGSLPENMQKIIQAAAVVSIPAGSVMFGKVSG